MCEEVGKLDNRSSRRRWRLFALVAVTSFCTLGLTLRGQQAQTTVVVYKTAGCGCCRNWVEHLRRGGFEVKVQDVDDIAAVRTTYGVPPQLSACHTALAGGYVIEGHVPADTVKRILRDRPNIAGIAVPGMPVGSPGMETPGQNEAYQVISFERNGKTAVLETRR